MRKLIMLIPVIIVSFFIMSIVLYIKRKRIIDHYNQSFGYISCFIFASFMLTPILVGIPMYLFEDEAKVLAPFTVIYMVPALIWYIHKVKKSQSGARLGMFFAMLGIGICAPLFLLYKFIIGSVTDFSGSYGSGGTSYYNSVPSFDDNTGNSGESGQTVGCDYSEGRIVGSYGQTTGYVYPDGRIAGSYGQTTGYVYPDGHITDASGHTKGYIYQDGLIVDEVGHTAGYIYPDGRITDETGKTTGYIK